MMRGACKPAYSEYADLEPVPKRACGRPSCPPEGCFSRWCWVDAPSDEPETDDR